MDQYCKCVFGKKLGNKSRTRNATSSVTNVWCNMLWKWVNTKDSVIRPKNDCFTDEESSVMFVVKQGWQGSEISGAAPPVSYYIEYNGWRRLGGVGNRNAVSPLFYCQCVLYNFSHNLDCTRYSQIMYYRQS